MLSGEPVRTITLDLDDTLWPVAPTIVEAERTLSDWLAEHAPATAVALTLERRKEIRAALVAAHPDRAHDVSFMRREALREALRHAGDDPGLAEPGFERFLAARQRVTLFDDVLPVLERWHRRYSIVAISNGNADVTRMAIGRFFRASVSAHETGFAKPDPRMFATACERAGVPRASALHIGDDLAVDVRAAREAGLQALWLRRPELTPADHPARGSDHGEKRVFECLRDIDRLLHPD